MFRLIENVDYVVENGYRVLTEDFLLKRGYCCGNGCKNCPYFPQERGSNIIKEKGTSGEKETHCS